MAHTVVAEVEVLVPVKVKVDFTILGSEEVNINFAIKQFLAGNVSRKVDVTFGNLHIIGVYKDSVNKGDDVDVTLVEVINENFNGIFKSRLISAVPQ